MNSPDNNSTPIDFDAIQWNDDGLIAAIAQEVDSGRVLMMAWMNQESLRLTIEEGRAVYYSRSRCKLWRKGEESGNVQKLVDIAVDCDGDTLLLQVEQIGGIACHTGRQSCFYRSWKNGQWQTTEAVLKDPKKLYQ